jgi:hypothetical protein
LKRTDYALLAAGIEPPNKRSLAEESFPDEAPSDSGLLSDKELEMLKDLGVPSGDESGVEAGWKNLLASTAGDEAGWGDDEAGWKNLLASTAGDEAGWGDDEADWKNLLASTAGDEAGWGDDEADWKNLLASTAGDEAEPVASHVDNLTDHDIHSGLGWLRDQLEANPESTSFSPLPGWDDEVSATQ